MAEDDTELHAVSAWLAAGAGGAAPADQVIETHIGQVFLIGDHAFKLKKAAHFGYLDFSTRAARAQAIARELELNRRTAPDIYQSVRQVTRGPDGALAFDGPGVALEAVLQMRRFDPDAVLDRQPQIVAGDFAEALGRQIADFHAGAGVRPGDAGGVAYVIASNAEHLRDLAPNLGAAAVAELIAQTEAAFTQVQDLIASRAAAGQRRACHGDLHLGNILQESGRAVLFDCIEFNDRLSEIDVLYDLAFLLMDLCHRGQDAGANRVLNGYLDQAARMFGEEPLRGLACLPLFLSMRAAVRCHVSAHMGQLDAARGYLQSALAHLQAGAVDVVAIGGLSGSGKSTLARQLAPACGSPPGAVVLRSDEIRKRLWRKRPAERLPPEAYAPEQSERVYDRMLAEARLALTAGRGVILDAAFLRISERQAAEAVAFAFGTSFEGVWLEAPAAVLAARIAARHGDASDADVTVLRLQLQQQLGRIEWRRVEAGS